MNIEAKKFVLFHIYRGVTPLGPLHWQPEVDSELTLSASTAAALDQKSLLQGKYRNLGAMLMKSVPRLCLTVRTEKITMNQETM